MERTMRLAMLVVLAAAGCGEVSAMVGSPGVAGAGGSGSAGTGGGLPGGATGTAGSLAAGCPAASDLLSDFSAAAVLVAVDKRHGAWRTDGDGAGTLQPPETAPLPLATAANAGNPSCSGSGSLHVTSSGFSGFGSRLFVPLAADVGELPWQPYNAAGYKGISFWARSAGAVRDVHVEAWDAFTTSPTVLGSDQACIYDSSSAKNCSPYGAAIGDGLIDSTWRRFELTFAEMVQDPANPGQKSPGNVVDASRLTALVIRVGGNQSSDLWIDDVAFVR